jgi:subfamily B ATP-binding cassette protein MsbA
MGKSNATEEEIRQAVKNACLEDFIANLPEGLDTRIGERGTLLSGGQKQRIAIARAFIKNAPIVILDEATSALDNKSEKVVQEALDNLMKDRTVFVIAHRLTTIQNADQIIVVNEGNIVEKGTHDELLALNGFYSGLYNTKLRTAENEENGK